MGNLLTKHLLWSEIRNYLSQNIQYQIDHDESCSKPIKMASDEPLFDPSLKKRKKKQVAFSEDPLGPDADPTAPAPEVIDTHTLNGDVVDLGAMTVHEQMKRSGVGAGDGEDVVDKKKEEDEFKAMFSDMKKKKKKKEIPIDLVR